MHNLLFVVEPSTIHSCPITRGRVDSYVIKRILRKHGVPVALDGVVGNHHNLELVLPLGVEGEDLVDEGLATHGAHDGMAGGDQ